MPTSITQEPETSENQDEIVIPEQLQRRKVSYPKLQRHDSLDLEAAKITGHRIHGSKVTISLI